MEDRKYYVCGHFRHDNGKCYYIGKGHGNRYKKRNARSKLHKYITDKYSCDEYILINNLTEEEACAYEIKMIESYINTGYFLSNNCSEVDENGIFLVNHTIGGEDGNFKSGKKNPELKLLYYSRPGSQNGRSKSISVFDKNDNFIKTFSYIGECCEWLKDRLSLSAKINSMRGNISIAAKQNKPYHGYYFSFN